MADSNALKWGLALIGAAGAYASITTLILNRKGDKLRSAVDTYLHASPEIRPTIRASASKDAGISPEAFDTLAEQVRQDYIRKGAVAAIGAIGTILPPQS